MRLAVSLLSLHDCEMSATSHSITFNQPLRYQQVARNRFAVQGTPADCVILASLRILEEKPALVVSGVNRGSNVGDDIIIGNCCCSIRSRTSGNSWIAVSTYAGAESISTGLHRRCICRTRLGVWSSSRRHSQCELSGKLERRSPLDVPGPSGRQDRPGGKPDPRGREYFWLHEELHSQSKEQPAEDPLTDFAAIAAGFVSVRPCVWIAPPILSQPLRPMGRRPAILGVTGDCLFLRARIFRFPTGRGSASARAPGSGPGGRRFKSSRPDIKQPVSGFVH